jgi:hypothetical protein
MTMNKVVEHRIRRLAARTRNDRSGYRVHESRTGLHVENHVRFLLVEHHRNVIVLGERYEATLADMDTCEREIGAA